MRGLLLLGARLAAGLRAFTAAPAPRPAAHVRNGSHFVLLTGWDAATAAFAVRDPFYNVSSYAYDDMSDVITYKLVQPVLQPVIPRPYPVFKQCDPRWGNTTMVRASALRRHATDGRLSTRSRAGAQDDLQRGLPHVLDEHGPQCARHSRGRAARGQPRLVQRLASAERRVGAGRQGRQGRGCGWMWASRRGPIHDPSHPSSRPRHRYDDDDDLLEEEVYKISPQHVAWPDDAMHKTNDLPLAAIQQYLYQGAQGAARSRRGRSAPPSAPLTVARPSPPLQDGPSLPT